MRAAHDNHDRRAGLIAALLWYGTWIASASIAAGMALAIFPHTAHRFLHVASSEGIVRVGIALFIVLPIARVALMLGMFLRDRDHVYAAISALVLAIITAGIVIGIQESGVATAGSPSRESPSATRHLDDVRCRTCAPRSTG
jgi:amino acid transporter